MATDVATVTGTPIGVSDEALEELRMSIRGNVLTPDDPGYAAVRPVYNSMNPGRPAIVVEASGTADVIDAVNFAREHGLLTAVRGGGHSVAGLSSVDDGMLIDLAPMNGVVVDPEARTVVVQGGALWGDVDRETQAFGLIAPGGVVSDTGVAGLDARRRRGMGAPQVRLVVRQPALGAARVRGRRGAYRIERRQS